MFTQKYNKYKERFDIIVDSNYTLENRHNATYNLYDKYGSVIVLGLKSQEANTAKRVVNDEEKAYIESIYNFIMTNSYNLI